MARIRIKNLDRVERSIRNDINRAISTNGENLQRLSVEVLKEQIQSGINPETNRPYASLADSTIDYREYIARYNPTDQAFVPPFPNQTLTGQLLAGLKSTYNQTTNIIRIFLEGNHPGYRGKQGQILKGSRKSRAEIAGHLEGQGRPVLSISQKLADTIVREIERALRRL